MDGRNKKSTKKNKSIKAVKSPIKADTTAIIEIPKVTNPHPELSVATFAARTIVNIPIVYINLMIFLYKSTLKISMRMINALKRFYDTYKGHPSYYAKEAYIKLRPIVDSSISRSQEYAKTLPSKKQTMTSWIKNALFISNTYISKVKTLLNQQYTNAKGKFDLMKAQRVEQKKIASEIAIKNQSIALAKKAEQAKEQMRIAAEKKAKEKNAAKMRGVVPAVEEMIKVSVLVMSLRKAANIILWPFRIIMAIIKRIYNFEIKVRIFSFKTIFAFMLILGIYIFSIFYFAILQDIPSPDNLARKDPNLTTRIYDRKGNLLYNLYYNEDRSLVSIKDIPQNVINATIAIEDEGFYTHNGLSIKGIARAAKKTFWDSNMEGGSTITQQLVKNTLLSPERTYERKIKEAIISLEVERRFSKEQILEMYLNNISYGGTAYGIKSAAKKYFGKDLKDLTLAESAFLAGLPGAPSVYSPFSATPEKGKDRQEEVLNRMVKSNFITQDEANNALLQELVFNDKTESIIYPHFVNYVIDELEKKYGQMLLQKGGLEVYTSIDPEVQDSVQDIVSKNVARFKPYNVHNGAALVTDPKTGEIIAMVGSANYWDVKNDGNVNITTSLRQPGSSIKPVEYSYALEHGYRYDTKINDKETVFHVSGQPEYKPVNYDGHFHGEVTLKTALANSYNIPAVKLVDSIGIPNVIDWARTMGITSWNDPDRYGLSIALGAAEVKMTDMAVVYGTFANMGYQKELNPILKVYDTYGNVLEENNCVNFLDGGPSILTKRAALEFTAYASGISTESKPITQCPSKKIMSDKSAYYISYILSDNAARTPAFGANSNLNITARQVAVKTGTTSNLKDNWAIGYTDNYVVSSWIGNNDGQQMRGVASGYGSASAIWRETFNYLINNKDIKNSLSRPDDIVEVNICPLTNTLACSACDNVKRLYARGEEPQRACTDREIEDIKDKQDKDKKKNNDNSDNQDNSDGFSGDNGN